MFLHEFIMSTYSSVIDYQYFPIAHCYTQMWHLTWNNKGMLSAYYGVNECAKTPSIGTVLTEQKM